ncbi:MAG: pyridoxamine 5'-phosphate oxidase family protein [Gammaproteobacteria bacterium]|nr:MAG: pyridoxamine 5'-phosphate oxidase family protein [Gammaproteobacteria bacterium]
MGRRYDALTEAHREFIARQKLFFVATAGPEGTVNLSPKGHDSLRVLDAHRLVWLNLTGSGNETAAHLRRSPRITLMFCAFTGPPLILRIYGRGRVHHPGTPGFEAYLPLFPALPGARQIVEVAIEQVQTSCGMGVPLYHYVGDRRDLLDWAARKGEEGIRAYWKKHNTTSLDGRSIPFPAGLLPEDP